MSKITITDLKANAASQLCREDFDRITGGGDPIPTESLSLNFGKTARIVDAADYVVWRKTLGTGL